MDKVNPDEVIHLAWSLNGPGFLQSAENIQWLEASLSLLRYFKGEAFFFAGSSAEYGTGTNCKEDDPCYPISLYGECKKAFERTAAWYCAEKGIRFVCTRFFSVYGPYDLRQGRALPSAIRAFLNNEPFICKEPNNTWDYIFTEDVGRAMSKLLKSDFTGAVNFSSGKAITMREAFLTIAETMGKKQLLSFKNERLPGRELVGDNTLLRQRVGFDDFTDFREGIRKTVQWWEGRK